MSNNVGATAQDESWKARGQASEAQYIREKEQAQLSALRDKQAAANNSEGSATAPEKDFEGGFGGQEDLEDRYATTSGEH